MEPVLDYAIVVGGELEQSLEEEGRTGAASDIDYKGDRLGPPLLIRRYNKTKPHRTIKKMAVPLAGAASSDAF